MSLSPGVCCKPGFRSSLFWLCWENVSDDRCHRPACSKCPEPCDLVYWVGGRCARRDAWGPRSISGPCTADEPDVAIALPTGLEQRRGEVLFPLFFLNPAIAAVMAGLRFVGLICALRRMVGGQLTVSRDVCLDCNIALATRVSLPHAYLAKENQ